MSLCKSCGAEVIWATHKGERIPFDRKPWVGGTYELTEVTTLSSRKTFEAAYLPPALRAEQQELYTTHFATCPEAGRRRTSTRRTR